MARADGADLYFERRGRGPALLLILGGGGDCGYYAALADILASEYTVITSDRRGNSRSWLHEDNAELVRLSKAPTRWPSCTPAGSPQRGSSATAEGPPSRWTWPLITRMSPKR